MEEEIAEEIARQEVIPLDLAIERELACRRRSLEMRRGSLQQSQSEDDDSAGLLDLTAAIASRSVQEEDPDATLRYVVVERLQMLRRLVEAVEKMRRDMPVGAFVPVGSLEQPPPPLPPLPPVKTLQRTQSSLQESHQHQFRRMGSSSTSPKDSYPKPALAPSPPPPNRYLVDLRSDVCRVHCMSAFNLQQHFQSKKHLENCREYDQQLLPHQRSREILQCDICQFNCLGAYDLQQHFQREEHQQKCKEFDRKPAADHDHEQWVLNRYCNICQVRCSGEFNLQQHLEGQKHLMKCNALKIREKLGSAAAHEGGVWCDECRIQCPDTAALVQHRAGRRHAARLRAILELKSSK